MFDDEPEFSGEDLTKAFKASDFTLARKILEKCPEIILKDWDGSEPAEDDKGSWLVESANYCLEAVKLIVEFGIDVNARMAKDFTAISTAAHRGKLDIVQWLLEQDAEVQEVRPDGSLYSWALMGAAMGGHLEIVKLLVEHGANVHSRNGVVNALMQADFYGHNEVSEFLRSHGAVDLRETTPPDYEDSHRRLLTHMTDHRGPVSDWKLELKSIPGVTLHLVKANKRWKSNSFFTIGLSDRRLPNQSDPYAACELRFDLPKRWPYSARALGNPKHNWPFVWLERIASELVAAEKMPNVPVIFQDQPPQPLGENTKLSHWLCLHAGGEAPGMPDTRWIDFWDLHPVYSEEAAFVRERGHEAFARQMHEKDIPTIINPKRENICE
ncbi:ankyrin repeat domain-containing protein [Mariniblastus sp.]|nr:ankyrin repeat domain-containing protein [Mariniblastus sp.]